MIATMNILRDEKGTTVLKTSVVGERLPLQFAQGSDGSCEFTVDHLSCNRIMMRDLFAKAGSPGAQDMHLVVFCFDFSAILSQPSAEKEQYHYNKLLCRVFQNFLLFSFKQGQREVGPVFLLSNVQFITDKYGYHR